MYLIDIMSQPYQNLTLDSSDSDDESLYLSAVEDLLENESSRSSRRPKAMRGRPFRIGMSNGIRKTPDHVVPNPAVVKKPIIRIEKPNEPKSPAIKNEEPNESEKPKFSFFTPHQEGKILSARDVGFSDSEDQGYDSETSRVQPNSCSSGVQSIKKEEIEEYQLEDSDYLEDTEDDPLDNKNHTYSNPKKRRSPTPVGKLGYIDIQNPKKRFREQAKTPPPQNSSHSSIQPNQDKGKGKGKQCSNTPLYDDPTSSSSKDIDSPPFIPKTTRGHSRTSSPAGYLRSLPTSIKSIIGSKNERPPKYASSSDEEDVEPKEIDLFPMRSIPPIKPTDPSKPKRVWVLWSPEEEKALEEGIVVHGEGRWKKIKAMHPEVLKNRSPDQIKDKTRCERRRRIRLNIPLGVYASKSKH
ncbi:hypothetical protein CLU79DRAFT_732999 [Phycomyces nitens]|nr:hypothetical protein CLU79DRAFT_732999 [Phycomyces nitens]